VVIAISDVLCSVAATWNTQLPMPVLPAWISPPPKQQSSGAHRSMPSTSADEKFASIGMDAWASPWFLPYNAVGAASVTRGLCKRKLV